MKTETTSGHRAGEILVAEGLIHPDDVHTALAIQKKQAASVSLNKSRLLGMILCDLNLITPIDNYAVLHKHNKLVSLPTALVQRREISPEKMQAIEMQSLREDEPLISLLLKTNAVSMQTLQQVLFDLFHIPFRSISDFIFNEDDRIQIVKILDKQMSMQNGIIPMVLKENTVLFGITAPENLMLIQKLNRRFPQYRFKVLFIMKSGFSWFHDIIYAGQRSANLEEPKEVQPDISLLLGYKTIVNDPRDDKAAIKTLYHQYETLRKLLGNDETFDRRDAFKQFIGYAHERITKKTDTRRIEFSFKSRGRDVLIVAKPR